MSNNKFYNITWTEFSWFLNQFRKTCREFTQEEYQIDEENLEEGEIWEHCYVLILNEQDCIKIYTTFSRNSKRVRAKGKDSLKIVAADRFTFKPILNRFPHTKRLLTWKQNLMEKIMDAVYLLGYETTLKKCGHAGILRENHETGILFLGCSKFEEKKCKETEPLRKRPGNQSKAPKEREIFSVYPNK